MVSPSKSRHPNPCDKRAKRTLPERNRLRHTQLTNAYTLKFETLESRNLLAATIENFPGMNSASSPPDTVGDVGPKHYIQMVNSTQYQIFNKTAMTRRSKS